MASSQPKRARLEEPGDDASAAPQMHHRKCIANTSNGLHPHHTGGCFVVLSRNVRAPSPIRVGEFVGNWQFDAETNSHLSAHCHPPLGKPSLGRRGLGTCRLDWISVAGSMHSQPGRVTMTMMKLIYRRTNGSPHAQPRSLIYPNRHSLTTGRSHVGWWVQLDKLQWTQHRKTPDAVTAAPSMAAARSNRGKKMSLSAETTSDSLWDTVAETVVGDSD
uniref:Uncharacterized protein n=1 Tax=Anopheles atroparvus TaxID=41427 RepID=A0A182J9V1_ANOAO